MRSRKVLLGLTCLAANTMLLSSTAHADRRTGLGGNLLIEDKKDTFAFPQLTLKYRNMLLADYGTGGATCGGNPAGSCGNGLFTFGTENMAFGVALHRGDILSPDNVGFNTELQWLGGVESQNPFSLVAYPGAASPNVAPATFVDAMMGMALGTDSSLGFRLGFGRAADIAVVDGDASGSSQTFIAAQVGYSRAPENALRLDLSGNLVFALAGTDAAGDDVNTGTFFRVGALGRAYWPLNDVVDIGAFGNLSISNQHNSVDTPEDSANAFNGGLLAGVGPVISVERATIGAYAGARVAFGMNEPSSETDDDENSSLTLVVPNFRLSAEVQLLDWMYVRTGLDYAWNMTSTYYSQAAAGNPGAAAGEDGKTRVSNSAYLWNAGLGVVKGNFNLDGVISNTFMTNGPAFIGGGAPGFLAIASLTYRFGDVFSDGAVPAQEQTAPAAEPAPVEPAPVEPAPAPVEPAPEQESAAPGADASGTATGTATGTSASGSVGGGLSIGR